MKKKDIKPRNQKGNPHGLWEVYNPNGSVIYKCFYNNSKEVGYEEWYFNNDNELTNKIYNI